MAGLGIAYQVRDGVQNAAAAPGDVGYTVEELEPPSIEVAAQTALVMHTADLRAGWELLPYPPRTKSVVSP